MVWRVDLWDIIKIYQENPITHTHFFILGDPRPNCNDQSDHEKEHFIYILLEMKIKNDFQTCDMRTSGEL
jgi:hypothetical protein